MKLKSPFFVESQETANGHITSVVKVQNWPTVCPTLWTGQSQYTAPVVQQYLGQSLHLGMPPCLSAMQACSSVGFLRCSPYPHVAPKHVASRMFTEPNPASDWWLPLIVVIYVLLLCARIYWVYQGHFLHSLLLQTVKLNHGTQGWCLDVGMPGYPRNQGLLMLAK